MYGCAACGNWSDRRICEPCAMSLQAGPQFRTLGGVLVTAAYRHHGAARRLVHDAKYRRLASPLDELARAMAERLPPAATGLVPVPRATLRRWRYGLDPADALARRIGRRTGLPVLRALRPAPWWPRHAGQGDRQRSAARFTSRAPVAPGAVMIDDVATTGATLDAAAAVLGAPQPRALVATSPSRVLHTLVNTHRPAELRPGEANVSPARLRGGPLDYSTDDDRPWWPPRPTNPGD